jgi:Flp pilus assembly protein TadG
MNMRNPLTSYQRNPGQHGQAMVEFMFATSFLVLLIISMLEVFGFIYTYSVVADAAKEGVRYAIVHGTDSTIADNPGTSATASNPPCNSSNATTDSAVTGASVDGTTNTVKNFAGLSLHSTQSMHVYVCYLDGNNLIGSRVEVAVNYPFRPFFFKSWGKWSSLTVFANAAGRIVY